MASKSVGSKVLNQFLLGCALLLVAWLMLPEWAAAVPGVLGLWMLKRSSARYHGIRTEIRAFNKLDLPASWTVKQSQPVVGLGDVDIMAVSPDGVRYAIEVKAHRMVTVTRPFLGFGGGIRYKGAKPPKDPVKQVLQLSARLNAKPIVWFPNAPTNGVYRFPGNPEYHIVLGKPRGVRRAMGITGFWGF